MKQASMDLEKKESSGPNVPRRNNKISFCRMRKQETHRTLIVLLAVKSNH